MKITLRQFWRILTNKMVENLLLFTKEATKTEGKLGNFLTPIPVEKTPERFVRKEKREFILYAIPSDLGDFS